MSRMVKEFVEIKDYASLDELIQQLAALRETLPAGAEPEVKMRGDDVFGRQLTIIYSRRQTAEEAECEARYAAACRESRAREQEHRQVGTADRPRRRLRVVA